LEVASAFTAIVGSFAAPLIADRFGVDVALEGIAVVGVVVGIGSVALMRQGRSLVSGLDQRRLDVLRSSVFGGLLPIRLEEAARALVPVAVQAGQAVIKQGDVAVRFYFIDAGSFKVSQRGPGGGLIDLRVLGPGEVFGEIGLLTSAPRTATVTAMSNGRLFALDREGFLGLVNAGPGLTTQLLDRYRGMAVQR
jgi:hypothetical protein